MFRLYQDYASPANNLRPTEVANDFVAALALDPGNSLVLANLETFYELLATPAAQAKVNPEFAIKPSEIESRLAKVKAIRRNIVSSRNAIGDSFSQNTIGNSAEAGPVPLLAKEMERPAIR
jgi:hypothetical protein